MIEKVLKLIVVGLSVGMLAVPVLAQNPGACCEYMGSWNCNVTTQEICEGYGGIFAGEGTDCNDNPCETIQGACCYGDGECAYVSVAECDSYNGEFKGPNTDCYDDPEDGNDIAEICEQPVYGACCYEDPMMEVVHCSEMTEDNCAGNNGTFLGEGTYCDNIDGNANDTSDICEDAPGACCFGDGSCSVLNALDCQLQGGEFKGADTDCYDDPEDGNDIADICEEPPTGACCEYLGSWECRVTTQEICEGYGGIFAGVGTDCSDNPCESLPGACCYGDGECAYVSQSECYDYYYGDFKGADTDCYDDPEDEDVIAEVCEEPVYGACCYEDPMMEVIHCSELTEIDCAANNGTFLGEDIYCINIDGNGNDISDLCEDAPGACCLGDGSCSVLNALDCQLQGGEFKGAGTDCYDDPEDDDDIAEICEVTPTGACCFYDGFGCQIVTQEDCELYLYGTYMGDDTECGEYSDQTGWSNCESAPVGACCWNDGFSCWVMTELECVEVYNGSWKGEDTDCSDNDENDIADICEDPNTYEYLPGDANMAAGAWPPSTIGGDVTYLVNYFRGITAPCMLDGFYASADANGDCGVTGADVTKLVSYFRGMDDLSFCQDYPTTWPPIPDTAPDGWPNCASPVLSK